MAFLRNVGSSSQVHTRDPDGSNVIQLTSGASGPNNALSRSSDGTKIAFGLDGATPGTAVMNSDGTGMTVILAGSSVFPSDWAIGPAGADLSVPLTDAADPVPLGGSPNSYTVSVANAGPAGTIGASMSTTLSGTSATINSATSSQGSYSVSAPTVSCALGNLAASGTATVTGTPAATGTITATTTADVAETDPDASNDTDAESISVNNALGRTGTAGYDSLNGTNRADEICGLGDDDITGGNDTCTVDTGDTTTLC